jgi:hypothetical protein
MKQEVTSISTFTAEVVAHQVSYNRIIVEDGSRDSAVGITTACRLDGRGLRVRVPVGTRFLAVHVVQIGSGAYPMSSGGYFPGCKFAGA